MAQRANLDDLYSTVARSGSVRWESIFSSQRKREVTPAQLCAQINPCRNQAWLGSADNVNSLRG